jgi:hypothetical protein
MSQSSSNPFTVQVQAPAAFFASFTLSSATGGANLPFTLGQAFRQGQVPAGKFVGSSLAGLQVTPKNYWPDGSLKFAILSGRATLAANAAQSYTLNAAGAAATAAALGTASLRATNLAAVVGAGSFGSASWSGADWDAPFAAWISGPAMSSWIYRKPIGSDAHLVAWLEVRLYAGGAVEVLPWVENGYLKVAGPTSKSATYSFTLGGTQRFSAAIDLPHHCRTVLLQGTAHGHWLATDPRISPSHDKAYLQNTRLVPYYRAAVPSTAAAWSTLASSYAPLQQSNYAGAMGQTGYHPAIGLLPEWDVLYLAGNDARALPGVLVNAYSAGRYPIHYRDESTNRPPRFSSYPNLVLGGNSGVAGTGGSSTGSYTPAATGTAPPVWDSPHHPSVGYTAYLLTGRYYFMEEVQFAATLHYLKNTDNYRLFAGGVFQSASGANTVRGAAWSLRTLAQALCVTPDGDALRTEFANSLAANVDWYHGIYVAKPNSPQGIVAPYANYADGSGKYMEAAWQQDFFTAALGYAIDLAPPLPAASSTRLTALFAWKAQTIIGRLGGTGDNEYLYCDAAVYTMAVARADKADFNGGTGPWYASWGDVYAATVGKRNPGVGGPLRGAYFPDPTSYWGNLQPAIAYAVQHNVPGAQAAYARMTGASNWNQIVAGWNSQPVWSVAPRAN